MPPPAGNSGWRQHEQTYDAVALQTRGKTARERMLGDPDGSARLARASLGLANAANRSRRRARRHPQRCAERA